jgi:tetratricopeptide (TPR) repeat protein
MLNLVLIPLLVLVLYFPADAQQEPGRAYYDFGVFAYEDGDYESALKNFQKALEASPDNPYYNHYLGKTYLGMERYEEAKKYLTVAWEKDPDISGLRYDFALLHYKMSNYGEAANLFAEVVKEDPGNVLALYHGGISLYKEKNYKKALDYLVRASERSPTIKTNGYYYAAICHVKLGQTDQAIEKLEYVKTHTDSESLRENAASWLQAVEKQKIRRKPYDLYLKLAYRYDDNVPLEPLERDIVPTDESDFAVVGYFSGSYNVVNRNDLKIGAGYSHYQTYHMELREFDMIGSIGSLYGKYVWYPFSFGLSYIPSYYWVDSDRFLGRHQLKPEVAWRVNEKLLTRLSYSYFDEDYFQDDNRDGHTHDVALDAYYSILGKRGSVFGGIGFEDKVASHPDEFYSRLIARLGTSLEIPWNINLLLIGRYFDKKYDNVDSDFGVKREDDKYQVSLSLSHRFLKDWLNILAEYDYTKNDSNISTLEYDRNVITLALAARY